MMRTALEIIKNVLDHELSIISAEKRAAVADRIFMELPEQIHTYDELFSSDKPLYVRSVICHMSTFEKIKIIMDNCDQEGHEKLIYDGTVDDLFTNHKEMHSLQVHLSCFSGECVLSTDGAILDHPEQFPGELFDHTEMIEHAIESNPEYIPLTDWAKREGISPATARQRAGRGTLETAHKIGRDWVIASYVHKTKRKTH